MSTRSTGLDAGPAASTVATQRLGEALREAIGHRGYLLMTLAFFACGFQLVSSPRTCRHTCNCAALRLA
jgi:hypothetical protein